MSNNNKLPLQRLAMMLALLVAPTHRGSHVRTTNDPT
jgi:hypothetical protein